MTEKVKGLYKYWNDDNIINELKIVCDNLGHFPKYSELRIINRNDLEGAINTHGGLNKFRKIFGLNPLIKPNGTWNDEVIIKELRKIIKNKGYFPTKLDLITLYKQDLQAAIGVYGGINKFRELLGYKPIQHSVGYWNEQKIIVKLQEVIKNIGHFPLFDDFKKTNMLELDAAIQSHGGTNKFRKLLGFELLRNSANYWNDEIIINELKKIIEKLGRFPLQKDLKIHKSGLIWGISKNGGLKKFRKILGYELSHKSKSCQSGDTTDNELKEKQRNALKGTTQKHSKHNKIEKSMENLITRKTKNYWTEDKIIQELKNIICELGHFPMGKELRNIKRCDIDNAIHSRGGLNRFRKILGYKSHWLKGYWTEENILKELREIIEKLKYFPSKNELSQMGRDDLSVAISRHSEGMDYFRNLLGYPSLLESCSKMCSYSTHRGKASEKEIKKILIKYCEYHNFSKPIYNKKLAKGNIIEFVCDHNKKIGIDVTNTKSRDGICIKRKYTNKDYHKYLDELWIVVFSNIYTNEDYIKFNEESPDNVRIMSVWDMINILQIDIDEYSQQKLKALEVCTIRTKNNLINQLKNRNKS